ncbi:MAG: phosphoglycerate dehydrogenase [Desulfobacterales bacterium]|nr:phosphoglycerate dehydrogenase [Desulfobacterales bacterium]
MFKVLICDNMAPVAASILESTGQIEVVVDNSAKEPGKLSKIINEFHGIALRSQTHIDEGILKNAGRLQIVGRAGVGVDNIDIAAATRRGIVVMNAPGGNTVTTAEHTISLMLSLARNIPQATASLRAGRWEKKLLGGVEITDKKLGIVGLGQIGKIVANRANGLKMNVIATDPFISEKAARELNVELVSLDDLLSQSDFITLHVPRLKETVNLINSNTISMMKPGVRIINCSRGEVVNLDDLFKALESGHIAGAALDVFPTEPPDVSLAIFKHPNIIFTPHLGASTSEAQNKVAEMIAGQIAAYLLNGVATNAINFPSISKDAMMRLKPHLDLSEKMGAMMGQLVRQLHNVSITYSGDVTNLDTGILTHAVLKGLLGSFTDQPVNYINAPALAKERGIGVRETSVSEVKGDFTGAIGVKLENVEDGPDEIWGSIFGQTNPRIVRLGTIYMDAIPEGAMLVIQNYDKPGVIGNVGTTLGNHNINIGRFHLGRREDRAFCIVNIDAPADEKVIGDLNALPNILSVQQVFLD